MSVTPTGCAADETNVADVASGPVLLVDLSSVKSTETVAAIDVKLEKPENLARNEENVLKLTYTNNGETTINAPLLTINVKGDDGQEGALLSLDDSLIESDYRTTATPVGFSSSVQLLASGETAGVLQPGESKTVEIYWAGWSADVPVTETYDFRVGVIETDNTEALNLDEFYVSMKPETFSEARWDVVWNRLQPLFGTTWGEYVENLGKISSYLESVGREVSDASALLNAELAWAGDAFNPFGTLTSSTDNSVSDSQFTLSFSREYQGGTLAAREYESTLGVGWDSNWNVKLTTDSEGVATILGAFGSARAFQPAVLPTDSEMAYEATSAGDLGQLVRNADRSFTLTENDGTVYDFNPDGTLAAIVDANGNRVSATHSSGRLTKLVDDLGSALEISYNAFGKIATVSDSNGFTTTYNYDATGKYLLSVDWADGRSIAYSYDETTGAMTSIAFADGTNQYFEYADGILSKTYYDDGMGAVSYVFGSTPETILTYSVYAGDALQGTVSLTDLGAAAKYVDADGRTIVYGYDEDGRLISTSNGAATSTIVYDENGNITQTTDGVGSTVAFAYNAKNWLTSLTDPNGNATTFTYDARGNLTSQGRVDGTASQTTYNADGTVATFVTRAGDVYEYSYDAKGEISQVALSTESNPIRYEYDDRGNTTKIVDANGGETTMKYDAYDRLTEVVYPNGRAILYGYDTLGRQISVASGEEYCVKYTYDAWGFLDQVLDGANGDALLTDYDYNIDGYLAKETRGNGTYTVYGYDALGYLTEKTTYTATGDALASFAYVYDELGQIAKTTTLDGEWTYGYDLAGQLTSAIFVAAEGSSLSDSSSYYVYDAAGNRVSATIDGVERVYTYNSMNQLLSDGEFTYTYDANGSMATKTNVATGEVWTYAWNQDGDMISATSSTGEKYEYEYDVFGNKTAVVHTAVDGTVTRTEYLVDPSGDGDVAAEYDGSGALVATYAYGLGLTSKTDAYGNAAYYAYDNLGSTATITAQDGSVLNRYAYDATGNAVVAEETIDNVFQFVGEYGVATGQNDALISMRARWYDPNTGRFVSEDSSGYAAGDANLYRYCGNNGVEYIDSNGYAAQRVQPTQPIGPDRRHQQPTWPQQPTTPTTPTTPETPFDPWNDPDPDIEFEPDENPGKKSNASNPNKKISKQQKQIVKKAGTRLAKTFAKMGARHVVGAATGPLAPVVEVGLLVWDLYDLGKTAYDIVVDMNTEATGYAAPITDVAIEDDTSYGSLNVTISTDLSGSMSGDINEVKQNSSEIVNALQDTGLEYSTTIMDFCNGSNIGTHESTNTGQIKQAINSWDVYNNSYDGGTELTNSMLMNAIDSQSRVNDGKTTNVIVGMSDEPCDSADRVPNQEVITAANATGTAIFAVVPTSGIAAATYSAANRVAVAPKYHSSTYAYWNEICTATGGKVISSTDSPNAAAIIEAILSVVDASDGVYYARNVKYGSANEPVSLTCARFASPDFKEYRWDFDDDGNYDATTETASVDAVWATSGVYRVRVQAIDAKGNESNETIYVDVADRFGEIVTTTAEDGSVDDLIINGWSGDDEISITQGSTPGSVAVCIDPTTGETIEYVVSGDIIVNAYDGANKITIADGLADRVYVFGGSGVDEIVYDASAGTEAATFALADDVLSSDATTLVSSNVDVVRVVGTEFADTFDVQASATTRFVVQGGAPVAGEVGGDSLNVSVASENVGEFVYDSENASDGVWNGAADDAFLSVAFESIETPATIAATRLATPTLEAVYGGSQIAVNWSAVENASGYLVEISSTPSFGAATAEFFTTETSFDFAELGQFSFYYFRVQALGSGEFVNSGWSNVVEMEIPEIVNVPEWNLADYNYSSYLLDASTASNYTATLYGAESDGTWIELQAWDFVGADAKATIRGVDSKAETLFVTGNAATLLGEINFGGGKCRLDDVIVEGTDGNDAFTIDSKVVVETEQVFAVNPYADILERYKTVFGEESPIYQNLVKTYDDAFDRLSKIVRETRTDVAVVALENGATFNLTGIGEVGISALDGDDSFKIVSPTVDYSLLAGNGSDTLDFSEAARASVDLSVNYRQFAVSGSAGTLALVDAFENVVGSKGSDRVVGGNDGLNFVGNGGSDVVILNGGDNTVRLSGSNQSVVLRGNGTNVVEIVDGDYSTVNAAALGTDASLVLDANGRNVTLFAGRGTVDATIVGDYANVDAEATKQAEIAIEGDRADVGTGKGDDKIVVDGDFAIVRAGAGNDEIAAFGKNATLYGGAGDDRIVLADGQDGNGGNGYVYAEAGNDVVFAANASGSNYFNAGAGNDVVVGSAGDDLVYGVSGKNVLLGLAGADRIFGGSGRDLLAGSVGSNAPKFDEAETEETETFLTALAEAWIVEEDVDKTIELLGESSVADGAKDRLYRGGGKRDLFYENLADGDVDDALDFSPFLDVVIDE